MLTAELARIPVPLAQSANNNQKSKEGVDFGSTPFLLSNSTGRVGRLLSIHIPIRCLAYSVVFFVRGAGMEIHTTKNMLTQLSKDLPPLR